MSISKNKIIIQQQSESCHNENYETIRKQDKIEKSGFNFSIIEFCFTLNLLFLCDTSSEIIMIDYEYGKIHGIL